jgi:hypothetical protein
VTILNGEKKFIDFPSVSQIWSCLEIIVHRAISSSLDVIALFGIDQEQQDKLVQPCSNQICRSCVLFWNI